MDFNPEQIEKEFLPFLSSSSRSDVRELAVQYFFGLTGSKEGCEYITNTEGCLTAICEVALDPNKDVCSFAFKSLVNLTAMAKTSQLIVGLEMFPRLAKHLLEYLLDRDSSSADTVSQLLSNLTREQECADNMLNIMLQDGGALSFEKLVHALCMVNYNTKHQRLDYIATFLCNLTQISSARKYILDKEKCVIQRLLPFTTYTDSLIRRGGIVGILHNCCFESDQHEWLLSYDVDILPRLLLPLAGAEELDEDDMDKLPVELQYLEPDKQREADPDIRILICEALFQLCATRFGREYLKEKNTYIILRELHKWEKDPRAKHAAENVVQILISDATSADNLKDVPVPQHLAAKIQEGFEQTEREIQQETEDMSSEAS